MADYDLTKVANNILSAYASAQSRCEYRAIENRIEDLDSIQEYIEQLPWTGKETISQGEAELAIEYLRGALRQFGPPTWDDRYQEGEEAPAFDEAALRKWKRDMRIRWNENGGGYDD